MNKTIAEWPRIIIVVLGHYFTIANVEGQFMSIKTLIQRQQVNYIIRSFSAQERAFMGLPKNYIGINPGYWAKGKIYSSNTTTLSQLHFLI